MARSLLISGQIHRERPPVSSVTSEAAANVSFQGPPQRPARSAPYPSQGNDRFASLLDSNAAADANNDSASAGAQAQPAWQRGLNDPSNAPNNNAADNQASSQNAPPANQSANNDPNDQNSSAGPPPDANANSDAPQPSQAKSGFSNTDAAQSDAKSSSGDASAADFGHLGTAGRITGDNADPGRRCDSRHHRADECSRCFSFRQRHCAACDCGGSHCCHHGSGRRRIGGCRSRRQARYRRNDRCDCIDRRDGIGGCGRGRGGKDRGSNGGERDRRCLREGNADRCDRDNRYDISRGYRRDSDCYTQNCADQGASRHRGIGQFRHQVGQDRSVRDSRGATGRRRQAGHRGWHQRRYGDRRCFGQHLIDNSTCRTDPCAFGGRRGRTFANRFN